MQMPLMMPSESPSMPKPPSKSVRFHEVAKVDCGPRPAITDFQPEATLTPVAYCCRAWMKFFYGVVSKVTSDTLVDCLTQ